MAVDSGPRWPVTIDRFTRATWSPVGGFLALSAPGMMSERVTTENPVPVLTRDWMLVDATTGRSIVSLPMPMTDPQERRVAAGTNLVRAGLQADPSDGDHAVLKTNAVFLTRTALEIIQLEIGEGGNQVYVLDKDGGIWSWVRADEVGLTRGEILPNAKIQAVKRIGNGVVFSDGLELQYRDNAMFAGTDDVRWPRKMRRSRGTQVTQLAADLSSGRMAVIDEEGFLTFYADGKRVGETRVENAEQVIWLRGGARVVIGRGKRRTRDGFRR